jgi:hypothetical protein
MGFRNQFATAVLPARLDLARAPDVVEAARLLCAHLAEVEARAAVFNSPILRRAYAGYRLALSQFAYVAARTSPLVEAVAALASRGPAEHDLRRVEEVVAAAVELLLCLDRGEFTPREFAMVRSGLLDLVDDLDQAAAVALLCQGFDQASRMAEVIAFPSSSSSSVVNRGGNDA